MPNVKLYHIPRLLAEAFGNEIYHTTSVSALSSILKSGYLRPGGSQDLISFSEQPLEGWKGNPVFLVLKMSAIKDKIVKVDYDNAEDFCMSYPTQCAYITGDSTVPEFNTGECEDREDEFRHDCESEIEKDDFLTVDDLKVEKYVEELLNDEVVKWLNSASKEELEFYIAEPNDHNVVEIHTSRHGTLRIPKIRFRDLENEMLDNLEDKHNVDDLTTAEEIIEPFQTFDQEGYDEKVHDCVGEKVSDCESSSEHSLSDFADRIGGFSNEREWVTKESGESIHFDENSLLRIVVMSPTKQKLADIKKMAVDAGFEKVPVVPMQGPSRKRRSKGGDY